MIEKGKFVIKCIHGYIIFINVLECQTTYNTIIKIPRVIGDKCRLIGDFPEIYLETK